MCAGPCGAEIAGCTGVQKAHLDALADHLIDRGLTSGDCSGNASGCILQCRLDVADGQRAGQGGADL